MIKKTLVTILLAAGLAGAVGTPALAQEDPKGGSGDLLGNLLAGDKPLLDIDLPLILLDGRLCIEKKGLGICRPKDNGKPKPEPKPGGGW